MAATLQFNLKSWYSLEMSNFAFFVAWSFSPSANICSTCFLQSDSISLINSNVFPPTIKWRNGMKLKSVYKINFLQSQDFFLRKWHFTKNPEKWVPKRNPDKIITKNPYKRKFGMEIYNFGPHTTLSLHEFNDHEFL